MKSLFSKPELVIYVCKAHYLPYLAQLSLDLEFILANQARKSFDFCEKKNFVQGKVFAAEVCFMLPYSVPGGARFENSLLCSFPHTVVVFEISKTTKLKGDRYCSYGCVRTLGVRRILKYGVDSSQPRLTESTVQSGPWVMPQAVRKFQMNQGYYLSFYWDLEGI